MSDAIKEIFPNKNNRHNYIKFFQILYEQNLINKKYNTNKNTFSFSREGNLSLKKPITVAHFIHEDTNNTYTNNNNNSKSKSKVKMSSDEMDLEMYYNGEKTNDYVFYDLGNILKESNNLSQNNYIISKENSEKNFYSLKEMRFYDKMNRYNAKKNDELYNIFKRTNNTNSYLSDYKITSKKFPADLSQIRMKKNKSIDNKNIVRINDNKLTQVTLGSKVISSKMSTKKNKNRKVMSAAPRKTNIFKNRLSYGDVGKKSREINDMKQINRFRLLKKELDEEKVKIQKMMSDFFKDELFNKYNHKEIILDIIKQKHILKRARSAVYH